MMASTFKHWTYCFFIMTLILAAMAGSFYYTKTTIVIICGIVFGVSLIGLGLNTLRPDHKSCWSE